MILLDKNRETVFLRKNPLMKLIDSFMVSRAKLQVKLIVKMGGRGNKIINDGLIRTKDGSWKSIKLGYLINNEIPEECINEDEKGRPTVILRFDNGSGNIEFMKPGESIIEPLDIRADDILERVDRKVYTEFLKSNPWKWLIGLSIAFMIGLGISFAFMANGIISLEQVIASVKAGAGTISQSGVIPGS